MESPLVDDDICILKHETAYVAESPVAACSGDESVASHFALVTAYEDIKKRLRDTERENTLLRKRVKQLEDKLFRPEAPPSEGPQYMNKAFSAYRGIYMEKKDLQAELNKLKKERVEAERMLQDQLQSKELEILQLRSELETSQVMKSLNETQDYWQVERSSSSCSTEVHLQEELERLRLENIHLHQLCTSTSQGISDLSSDVQSEDSQEGATNCRSVAAAGVMRSYEELCSEMSRLRSLLSDQSQLMKKLRDKPLPPVLRRAASALPVQCLDDVQKNSSPVRVTAPRPPSAPPLPSSVGRPTAAEGLQESSWKSTWPLQRPAPLGSPAGPSTPLSHSSPSLEDGSWSIPSHPRPSDALFWEGPKSSGSSSDWARPY